MGWRRAVLHQSLRSLPRTFPSLRAGEAEEAEEAEAVETVEVVGVVEAVKAVKLRIRKSRS